MPVSDADARPITKRLFAPKRGPAIVIATAALLGAVGGLPLLMNEHVIGLFGVVLGALCGGLVYRIASATLPIDPTARSRRYKFAMFSLATLPAVAVIGTGMQGQGLQMTIGAFVIGSAIAIGILVSGDRRAQNVR